LDDRVSMKRKWHRRRFAIANFRLVTENEIAIAITIKSIKKTDGLRKANSAPCSFE